MHLYLFEDRAEFLEPLTLTRPVFDLRCGMTSLGQKHARHVGLPIAGAFVRPALEDCCRFEHSAFAVNETGTEDVMLVNGAWLPPRETMALPTSPGVGMIGNRIAYVALSRREAGQLAWDRLPALLEHWRDALPSQSAGGAIVAYPWELVEHNAEAIRHDFAWLDPIGDNSDRTAPMVIGPVGHLRIAASARIEPMVVADTTQGPVVIDEDAVVTAFTRLEGPCYVGPKTQVIGAKIRGGTSLGPQCRVGGEVEASILHGYANKYHDGFLGHSYVGEWVNLGAGTHNSDLRNDYGEVVVSLGGVPTPTGMSKVGCFLGDHSKTGLGTLLNTGTSIGAFCNLLPAGRFAPKYVPSFTSWWNGSLREAFTLEQLLATADTVMQRRGVKMTAAHQALYARLHNETQAERRRAMRESEQRLLRKSA